jgi:hypothetical protein
MFTQVERNVHPVFRCTSFFSFICECQLIYTSRRDMKILVGGSSAWCFGRCFLIPWFGRILHFILGSGGFFEHFLSSFRTPSVKKKDSARSLWPGRSATICWSEEGRHFEMKYGGYLVALGCLHKNKMCIRYSGVCGCACFGCCSLIPSFGRILRFLLGFLGQENVMIRKDALSTFWCSPSFCPPIWELSKRVVLD